MFIKYKNNRLFMENVSISKIASDIKTPFYVYSAGQLESGYNKIKNAFSAAGTLICYSVKSNSNIAVLNLLGKLGSGADIVSGGELYRTLKAGIRPERIVFSGVGKTDEEIAYALRSGILMFNIESIGELEAIGRIAAKLKKKAAIAVRVNPDVEADTHHHITTGKSENKFGVNFPHVIETYLETAKHKYLSIKGIQMHIGSQIKDVSPYLKAVDKLMGVVRCLAVLGVKIEYLDIGGGFGIAYSRREKFFPCGALASAVAKKIKNTGLKLIVEPGRYISGPSGMLVASVIYTKYAKHKNFVIVDAAMNDLIRPAFYSAHHSIIPVHKKTAKHIVADIVGPICESGDFLAKGMRLESAVSGDLLAVKDAGAYGFVMSSNYNSRPRAAEVLVKGSSYKVVRQREDYNDLVKRERFY